MAKKHRAEKLSGIIELRQLKGTISFFAQLVLYPAVILISPKIDKKRLKKGKNEPKITTLRDPFKELTSIWVSASFKE